MTGRAVTLTHRAVALMLCALGAVHAAEDGGSAAAASATTGHAPLRSHAHRTSASTLDDRVRLMAKELDLDANQQAQVKGILSAQRAEVAGAWKDPSVPSAVRIAKTQAVSENTAQRIRAVLRDDQREKYLKAHQRDTRVGAPGGDVQKWMAGDPG